MRAEELIAKLAAEGELDSSGSFTLDPELALEKLREFQLRDPTRFVLSWVRAANLLGATRIDIEADADDVWVRFDGEALGEGEFEALWSAVMGQRGSPRVRACRELALGINGAFAWEAKAVTICSGTLQVAVDRAFALSYAQVEASSPINVVHAKRPLGWDLVRRRMQDARGELPEELLLAQLCTRGRVPVVLEGRLLEPPRRETHDWHEFVIDDDERRGHLRLRPGTQSLLRVLVSGVEVTTVELELGAGQVEALIDDPRLPLDLAQERPVEAERWQALLQLVSRVRWQAWFELAARREWPRAAIEAPHQARHAAMQLLIADIFASPDRSWTEAPGAIAFADQLVLPRAVRRHDGDLRALRSADADDQRAVTWPWPVAQPSELSLGELLRSADARGALFCSPLVLDDLAYVPELPVLLHAASPGLQALGGVTLDRPQTRARYREAAREHQTLAGELPLPAMWLELRDHVELPEGTLRIRVALERGADRLRPGCLCLGRAGRLLARYRLPPSWGPLWAELEGPIPDPEAPEFEAMLATCVLAMLGRHHELLAALVGEQLHAHERERIRDYLREIFAAGARWSARRLAELDVISASARQAAISSWRGGWGAPDEWVDDAGGLLPWAHAIVELPWLEQRGSVWSLRDLQRELTSEGKLSWVPSVEPRPTPPAVWRLDSDARAVIALVFPGALELFDHHAWSRRLPGAQRVPEQLDGARVSVPLRGAGGERGLLALARGPGLAATWAQPARRSARLQLFANGHALGWLDLPLPTGCFIGVIEVPHARAVEHADLARKDRAWREAARVVEAGARELAHALLEQWEAGHVEPEDAARLRDWSLDLAHGEWPEFTAALARWQTTLSPDHPLRLQPA